MRRDQVQILQPLRRRFISRDTEMSRVLELYKAPWTVTLLYFLLLLTATCYGFLGYFLI